MFKVLIGRFQLPHNGHLDMIKAALADNNKLIICLGSHGRYRDTKNPFTSRERETLIRMTLTDSEAKRTFFVPVPDMDSDEDWVEFITDKVYSITGFNALISLIGHNKDASSYYIQLFPWDIELQPNYQNLSSTYMREKYFLDGVIPVATSTYVKKWLANFRLMDEYALLYGEAEFLESYDPTKFPDTFMTADAVVECQEHILLIKRKNFPGKGVWALPGGFVKTQDTLLETMLAELDEETNIGIPRNVLIDSIVDTQLFDEPNRSQRGRLVTNAYHIKLKGALPQVTADDDAAEAEWVPTVEALGMSLFEDHNRILKRFFNIKKRGRLLL